MRKRYYIRNCPDTYGEGTEWIELSGKEFYQFVNSQEGKNRFFIDMGNVVLEVSEQEFKLYKTEKNHQNYVEKLTEGFSTVSFYAEGEEGEYSLLDTIEDSTHQTVEDEVISRINIETIRTALSLLNRDDYILIYKLYLMDGRETERTLAKELGISQAAVHKRKTKVLEKLRLLVIKIEKSQQ